MIVALPGLFSYLFLYSSHDFEINPMKRPRIAIHSVSICILCSKLCILCTRVLLEYVNLKTEQCLGRRQMVLKDMGH